MMFGNILRETLNALRKKSRKNYAVFSSIERKIIKDFTASTGYARWAVVADPRNRGTNVPMLFGQAKRR
jgi:hypothetical protein